MPILRRRMAVAAAGVAVLAAGGIAAATLSTAPAGAQSIPNRSNDTASPIKHLVVIFDENISYDHYFGTYPKAANTDGTPFYAATSTPKNNNLITSGTLQSNPNEYNPQRLTPSEALTCDQNHGYTAEQQAFDGGKMDQFVQHTEVDNCSAPLYSAPGLVMDYFDGNTVTAMWNYAQQYTLSDNSWDSTFGPSTPGALNLVAGQTHGFNEVDSTTLQKVPTPGSYVLADPDANGVGTVINDPDPAYDDCSDSNHTSTNTLAAGLGQNVGDLLNARGVTWGWFQGGFRPTKKATATRTYAVCGRTHTNIGGLSEVDYSPHHNPFQYYKSTSNPHHLPPSSTAMIGHTDQANHEYDLSDFNTALAAGDLPAVSFLKAAEYQDGHPGYSDPIDEQHFLVREINALESSPDWKSTAVVIAYDDSDGWYDHAFTGITNASHDSAHDSDVCMNSSATVRKGYQDRCGPGPRLPMLVISPYAKTDYIDNHKTEQSSVLRFIEDNWFMPRLGDGSFDARAGSLDNMFDFTQSNNKRVLLNTNGSIKSITPISGSAPMVATPVVTK